MSLSSSKGADGGQATIEAAVFVPIVFLLLVLLCQPAILLYDRMVMSAAAGQAVRMLSTRASDAPDEGYEAVIRSQLSAIPKSDVFHIGGDDWHVELGGNELSGTVSVSIENRLKPLPLVGLLAGAAGLADGDGSLRISVKASGRTQPDWVLAQGSSPAEWTGQWD